MADKQIQKKLAENEVYFRSQNERLQAILDDARHMSAEVGEAPPEFDDTTPLYFLCECSNEDCTERIKLSLRLYNLYHQHDNMFSIKNGHDIRSIEDVTIESDEFTIVTKKIQPPRKVEKLHKTSL